MDLRDFQEKTPLALYIIFYTFFSLIGITFFLFGNDNYLLLYEAFSGVYRPFLKTIEQRNSLIAVSYVAPLLFVASFWLTYRKLHLNRISNYVDQYLIINKKICFILYLMAISYLIVQIFKFIDFRSIFFAYTNYSSMIYLRFFLFQNLSVLDWILFYSFIPIVSGILYYKLSSNKAKYFVLFLTSFILLFTMQKRYILFYFIFIFFIHFFEEKRLFKNLYYQTGILTAFLIFIFSLQTFLPQSYLTKQRIVHQIQKAYTAVDRKVKTRKRVARPLKKPTLFERNLRQLILQKYTDKAPQEFSVDRLFVTFKNRYIVKYIENPPPCNLFSTNGKMMSCVHKRKLKDNLNEKVFSALGNKEKYAFKVEKGFYHFFTALLNRTSLPAVYYFELFPERRPFLGLNVNYFLPFTEKISEGKLIWNYINGRFAEEDGAIATPFNFSLYARIGVWGTLLISLMLGILSGSAWSFIQSIQTSINRSILSSIFCIYMIFMSMDNFKSSVYFTYGVFWWLLSFFVICLLSNIISIIHKKWISLEATV